MKQILISLFVLTLFVAADADAQFYGPFDYTDPEHYRDKLPVVEQYHFNRDVETLRGTMPGGFMGDHLWYVIRSFPNHHRALLSMEKLWYQHERQGSTPPPGVEPDKTPDYLYRRAIDFAPHDGVVRLLYGIYLVKRDKQDDAREHFEAAHRLAPDNVELQYNLGLMYIKLDDLDQALVHAQNAYAMNYPLEGLRNKLTRAGVWEEPAVTSEN